jgi:hypothetical protein
MTLAEWVRQVLENARRREQPVGSIGQKLGAVRVAAQHQFPTVDIEQPKS